MLSVVSCAPAVLAVLVFNIEYGGDVVDFERTLEVIERASPDVVAIEEAWGHIPRIARELGWPEQDLRHHVVSRLPLLDSPDGEGRVVFVETSPGCAVALGNVHLPSDPSIEDALRNEGIERAIALERDSRLSALEGHVASLRSLVETGMPAILAGDFNARSHLDDGLGWPTSRAVEAAGFRDAFREAHPDPKTHPGFTWWAARPKVSGWNPDPDSAQSRIDRLYTAGPVRVKDARILGEAGNDGVDVGVAMWPSDHRALLVTLELEPAPTPLSIAAWPPLVVRGEALRVRTRAFPPGSRVALWTTREIASREAAMADLTFATSSLDAGPLEVRLLDPSERLIGRARVFLQTAGQPPSLSLAPPEPETGEPIEASFAGAPGNRWDWVGVYRESADPNRDPPLLWRHTGARVEGETTLDERAEGGGWPLAPGAYRLYLCEDDSYRPLASAPFTVRPRSHP